MKKIAIFALFCVFYFLVLQHFFPDNSSENSKAPISFLTDFTKTRDLNIEALSGETTLADAKNILRDLDKNVSYFGLDKRIGLAPTSATTVEVKEIIRREASLRIFSSITRDLDKLVMSQAQVVKYCEKNFCQLVREDSGTLFLIKDQGHYILVVVIRESNHLGFVLLPIGNPYFWKPDAHLSIVYPKILSN